MPCSPGAGPSADFSTRCGESRTNPLLINVYPQAYTYAAGRFESPGGTGPETQKMSSGSNIAMLDEFVSVFSFVDGRVAVEKPFFFPLDFDTVFYPKRRLPLLPFRLNFGWESPLHGFRKSKTHC